MDWNNEFTLNDQRAAFGSKGLRKPQGRGGEESVRERGERERALRKEVPPNQHDQSSHELTETEAAHTGPAWGPPGPLHLD